MAKVKYVGAPEVGDEVYAPTLMYVEREEDDFIGGLCKVKKVIRQHNGIEMSHFIEVEECPEVMFNWDFLNRKQDEFEKKYGKQRAFKSPFYEEKETDKFKESDYVN